MYNHYLAEWQRENLQELTVIEAQRYLKSGEITSYDLLLMYLDNIAKYDKKGPGLNSIIEINPYALQTAMALDEERKTYGPRSELHGLPVLVKDNIEAKDMHTSAGSLALKDHRPSSDAHLVAELKKAGAIILGKTNLTEWANFMADNMTNGYSSRGGQVLNPYGPEKLDCGGSSSGSGVAVAANLTMLAIGTETSGSILSPSSSNSIVGIKPTVGLISRSGIIPISHSQDTAGPMARTVADAASLLNILAGVDESDPVTKSSVNQVPEDYRDYLEAGALEGARIGVPNVFIQMLEDNKRELMDRAVQEIESGGAEVIYLEDYPPKTDDWNLNVMYYEFKHDLDRFLEKTDSQVPVNSLSDVIAFNHKHKEVALKYGQERLLRSEETSGTLTESEYLSSKEHDVYYSREAGIDGVMEKYRLNALLFPANVGENIPARAGYPSITVPGGYTVYGEPLGITFTAKAYQEPQLIKLGYSYEQQTVHRQAPEL